MKSINLYSVVQLDPQSEIGKMWGPLLCVVDSIEDGAFFIRVEVVLPTKPGQPPMLMPIRVPVEACHVVGDAPFPEVVS